jgi:hypothetical protein
MNEEFLEAVRAGRLRKAGLEHPAEAATYRITLTSGAQLELEAYGWEEEGSWFGLKACDRETFLWVAGDTVALAAISTVTQNAEAIIVDHLRPAFEKVLTEAKSKVAILGGRTTAAEVLGSQDVKAVRAWMDLGRLGL